MSGPSKRRRSHRNTRRLTAPERAATLIDLFFPGDDGVGLKAIQRALQAHARQALRRDDRRDRR